jgi:hypothetical protein
MNRALENLEKEVAPLLERYRSYLYYLRPGLERDIYPWHSPRDVVLVVAQRLRDEGYLVEERPYTGCKANYSGGNYFLRVSVPATEEGKKLLSPFVSR